MNAIVYQNPVALIRANCPSPIAKKAVGSSAKSGQPGAVERKKAARPCKLLGEAQQGALNSYSQFTYSQFPNSLFRLSWIYGGEAVHLQREFNGSSPLVPII